MENKDKHPKMPSAGDEITASNTQSMSIYDNPDYVAPSQQDILLMDITSKVLHTTISGKMGVDYWSLTDEVQTTPLQGHLHGINKHLMVNVVNCRHRSCHSGAVYKNYVFFLCGTGSPNTFLCQEAGEVLLGKNP